MRYHVRLRGFGRARYLRSADDVHDIVQEAFLAALKAMERYDPKQPFWPWLRTICHRRIMDQLRGQQVSRSHHQAIVDDALWRYEQRQLEDLLDPQEDLEEQVLCLRRCMANLNERHRRLLQDRYLNDISLPELAQQQGKSVGATSMVLRRLRSALARLSTAASSSWECAVNRAELLELLEAYRDGDLDADGAQRLVAVLDADDAFADRAVADVRLMGLIEVALDPAGDDDVCPQSDDAHPGQFRNGRGSIGHLG